MPVKLEVDTAAILVPKIEAAMATSGPKSAATLLRFGPVLLRERPGQRKALAWVNEAVKLNEKAPYMMLLKARLLAKTGDKAGAIAAAKKSAELGIAVKAPRAASSR